MENKMLPAEELYGCVESVDENFVLDLNCAREERTEEILKRNEKHE